MNYSCTIVCKRMKKKYIFEYNVWISKMHHGIYSNGCFIFLTMSFIGIQWYSIIWEPSWCDRSLFLFQYKTMQKTMLVQVILSGFQFFEVRWLFFIEMFILNRKCKICLKYFLTLIEWSKYQGCLFIWKMKWFWIAGHV